MTRSRHVSMCDIDVGHDNNDVFLTIPIPTVTLTITIISMMTLPISEETLQYRQRQCRNQRHQQQQCDMRQHVQQQYVTQRHQQQNYDEITST